MNCFMHIYRYNFGMGRITTNIKIRTINGRFFYFIHALLYNTFSGYGCCNIFEILWTIGSNTSFITNSYQFIFTLLNKLLMFLGNSRHIFEL